MTNDAPQNLVDARVLEAIVTFKLGHNGNSPTEVFLLNTLRIDPGDLDAAVARLRAVGALRQDESGYWVHGGYYTLVPICYPTTHLLRLLTRKEPE